MAVAEKADRLARTGRVKIEAQDGEWITATVEGDSGAHIVTRTPEGWNCDCPAHTLGHKLCSHIGAVGLYERWGAVYEAEARARIRMEKRNNTNWKGKK